VTCGKHHDSCPCFACTKPDPAPAEKCAHEIDMRKRCVACFRPDAPPNHPSKSGPGGHTGAEVVREWSVTEDGRLMADGVVTTLRRKCDEHNAVVRELHKERVASDTLENALGKSQARVRELEGENKGPEAWRRCYVRLQAKVAKLEGALDYCKVIAREAQSSISTRAFIARAAPEVDDEM